MAGLARKKPFLLLAALFALVLLVLACTTKQHACYYQSGFYGYGGLPNDCPDQCSGRDYYALKIIRSGFDNYSGLRQVIRCNWRTVTGRLFLASACLMCLWVIIELLLTLKRKYKMFWNLFYIIALALGSVAAGFMLYDIQRDNSHCNDVQDRNNGDLQRADDYAVNNNQDVANNVTAGITPPGNILPRVTERDVCHKTIFTISFILQIIALVLFLAQFLYNIIMRKKMNEPTQKDVQNVGYAEVPTHHVATDAHVPVTEQRGTSENRIA